MPVTIENMIIYESSEIAKKLNAKSKDIENLIIKKKLKGQKIGNKFYVSKSNLENFFFEKSNTDLSEWDDFHKEALKVKIEHENGKGKKYTFKEVFGEDL
jgi:hypothetical protein